MLVAFIAARMQDASYAEAAIPALIVGCAAFALLAGHLLRRWSAPRPMRSVGLAIGAFGTALLVGVAVVEGGLAIARQTIPTESNEAGLMLFGLFGLPALAVAAFCGGLVTPSVVYRIAWRVWRRGEPRARASSPTR